MILIGIYNHSCREHRKEFYPIFSKEKNDFILAGGFVCEGKFTIVKFKVLTLIGLPGSGAKKLASYG